MEVVNTTDLITVHNFTKGFGAKSIHECVNFSVKSGECLGLLGGSGAGKSVILRSLIGLERPDKGEILFEGKNIVQLNETQLFDVRKKVAYVFQYGALFDSLTVYDNVAYSLVEHTDLSDAEIRKKVLAILDEFNLKGSENLLPSELSGGMQKRVGLARAIILEPKVVLYDEPTAGLDPANTITIQNLILHLKKKGSTSILVTHDIDTALRVCDRICFLKDRKVVDLGDVSEIIKNKEKFIENFLKDAV